jgi:hypothetical protein
MKLRSQQSGFHVVPVVSVVGVVLLVGAVGWLFWSNFGKSNDVALDAATKQAREECEKKADKDICKFLTNWKLSDEYRITSVMDDGTKSVYEIDGDNTYMKSEGEYAYEVITIGKVTYTKGGSTWYKSVVEEQGSGTIEAGKMDFDDPTDTEDASKTTYKLISKEACGSMQCFKYQIIDSEDTESTNYVWFDDKDYLARKTLSEYADGKYEATYEYSNITVKVPAPVKDLKQGEVIMPGQTEPTNILGLSE